MGNYLFNADTVIQALLEDARRESSDHDFGRDILPLLLMKRESTPTISAKIACHRRERRGAQLLARFRNH